MAGYTVKAPLVIAVDERGAHVYAYQGEPLPDSVKGDQLKRFVDEGFITKDEEPEAPKPRARRTAGDKDDSES